MSAVFRFILRLAAMCPPTAARKICRTIGWCLIRTHSESVHVARVNLALCFPDRPQAWLDSTLKARLEHMGLLFFEFAHLLHWPGTRLLAGIDQVAGEAELRTAFESERGVLLLVPHFGNWELLCAYLGHHFSVAALYDPPKLANLEPVILEARQRYQGEMFRIDTAGMRGMLKTMKRGGLVAILPDQVPDRDAGVYADFFGQGALTMTLVRRLAANTNPVVMMASVKRSMRSDRFQYALTFEPLSLDMSSDITAARSINAAIEAVVRGAPEQYQWEYKRFKRPQHAPHTNVYRDAADRSTPPVGGGQQHE